MMLGLPWSVWLLLAGSGLGLVIALRFHTRHRRDGLGGDGR